MTILSSLSVYPLLQDIGRSIHNCLLLSSLLFIRFLFILYIDMKQFFMKATMSRSPYVTLLQVSNRCSEKLIIVTVWESECMAGIIKWYFSQYKIIPNLFLSIIYADDCIKPSECCLLLVSRVKCAILCAFPHSIEPLILLILMQFITLKINFFI